MDITRTNANDHIFLSYRRLDLDFALRLATVLKGLGVCVWMDRFELHPSDDWRRGIEGALRTTAGMICALSPDYVVSEYCLRELATIDELNTYAGGRGPVFPVLVRPVPIADIPLEVRRLQRVLFYDEHPEWRDWRDPALFDERLQSLLSILRSTVPGQCRARPDLEAQYLNSLIADLESKRGVLEFIELSAEARERPTVRPAPTDEWGFSALIEEKGQLATPDRVAVEGIEAIARRLPRFVLLGEPGGGKTTTLRCLALRAARDRLTRVPGAPLPLVLYLPQWTHEASPAEFVRARWLAYGLPAVDPVALWQAGDVLLLFDGLNEMGSDGPRKAALLESWSKGALQGRLVVTCRSGDYVGKVVLESILPVLVRPLDDEQVCCFAERYLGATAAAFLDRVQPPSAGRDEDAESRGLASLIRNPYMLAALIFLYQQPGAQQLPHNNGALFARLTRALWRREQQRGAAGWRPIDQVESAFAKLAFAMLDEDRPIDVPRDYALGHLGDESLLLLGASASFLSLGEGTVRFYHQLFQEYFAAVELASRDWGPFIEPYELDVQQWHVRVKAHKWDEPLVALCGLLPEPSGLARRVAEANPFLGARCLQGGVDLSPDIVRQLARAIFDRLLSDFERLEREASEFRSKYYAGGSGMWEDMADGRENDIPRLADHAARVLADIGRPALPAMKEALSSPAPYVRYVSLSARGEIAPREAVPELVRALEDWEQVRFAGPFWYPAWMDLSLPMISSASRPLCILAARGLARLGTEVRVMLRDWVGRALRHGRLGDSRETVACVGPALLPVLGELFDEGDTDAQIELATILGAIGQWHAKAADRYLEGRPDGPGLLGLVVNILRARYKRETGKVPWLAGLLADERIAVRTLAAAAIGSIGRMSETGAGAGAQKPEQYREANKLATPALLVALADPDRRVRKAVVRALGEFDDLAVLTSLETRAESDADPDVRVAAARAAEAVRKRAARPTA